MTDRHPERRQLELFMHGKLAGEDSKDIVLHLLSGCDSCRRIARASFPCDTAGDAQNSSLPEQWRPASSDNYARVFDRVLPVVREAERELEEERELGPDLLAELERHPHERRLLLVRNSRRFSSPALCRLMLARARELGFQDPKRAVGMAELAVEILDQVHEADTPPEIIADLQGRAHGILANALRVSGDLQGALQYFKTADDFLSRGTGDEAERARMAELKSHVFGLQRDFDTAIELLNLAVRTYRSLNDEHRLGRALISKGFQHSEKGDLVQAVANLRQGLRYIDSARDPRLELVARHNLLNHLYETGKYHQAIAMIPETRALHEELGNQVDQIRFQWLVGQIHRDSGDSDLAEGELLEVKRYFVEQEIAHDSALVSLDLAAIFLRQHRTAELKVLATEMLTIFQALRINREAVAALVLFQRAVQFEKASLGLVRDLAAYLKNSRHDANLPFRPSLPN